MRCGFRGGVVLSLASAVVVACGDRTGLLVPTPGSDSAVPGDAIASEALDGPPDAPDASEEEAAPAPKAGASSQSWRPRAPAPAQMREAGDRDGLDLSRPQGQVDESGPMIFT